MTFINKMCSSCGCEVTVDSEYMSGNKISETILCSQCQHV